MHPRYSTAHARAKAEALCTFSRSFGWERRLLRASRKTRGSGQGAGRNRPRCRFVASVTVRYEVSAGLERRLARVCNTRL